MQVSNGCQVPLNSGYSAWPIQAWALIIRELGAQQRLMTEQSPTESVPPTWHLTEAH